MYSSVTMILMSLLIPELVHGSCQYIPQETLAIPGKKMSLDCLYKDSIRVPYRQSYRDENTCQDCSCKDSGLECCGFGNNAGAFHVEGCIEKKDGCYSTYVDANDPTKPCPSTQTTTQAPPVHNEQVPDNQVYRNPFASKGQDSRHNPFNSPNSLYNFNLNEKPSEDKAERQRQYEFLLSLLQYYMINGS